MEVFYNTVCVCGVCVCVCVGGGREEEGNKNNMFFFTSRLTHTNEVNNETTNYLTYLIDVDGLGGCFRDPLVGHGGSRHLITDFLKSVEHLSLSCL